MVSVPDISVVVPVYGSSSTLVSLYERVAAAVSRIPACFELIFVDDCGPGNPWEIISKMAQNDPRVVGLKLSRNYGQHNAIMAGVNLAGGRWLVIMDCDLQDRPEEIPRLWAKAHEGHDIVVGRRAKRQDKFFKRLFSRIFHEVVKYINNRKNDAAQSTFGIYSRRVIDKVKLSSEKPGIFPLLIQRTDFPVKSIDVEHGRRAEGKSSYTLKRKLSLAMGVIAFCSDQPLKIYVRFKIFATVAAFFFGIWIFAHSFLFGCKSVGWTRAIFISFLLSGIVFLAMGILEIYMRRIFNQLKKKSPYMVAERTPAT